MGHRKVDRMAPDLEEKHMAGGLSCKFLKSGQNTDVSIWLLECFLPAVHLLACRNTELSENFAVCQEV